MLEKVSDISNGRIGETKKSDETITDYANQLSPVRDLYRMDKAALEEQVKLMAAQEDPNEEFILPPANCGGITFTPNTTPTLKDMFGNRIRAIAQYGPDPRNIYYIQYNSSKTVNSPIVVLVHGGAWYSGPDPASTQGWHFGYTSNNNATDNIVLKMLNNGFVVVTMLYPLVSYGKDNVEILANALANTTTVQTQLNSIDLAINHIRTNFPTCVNLNANSIQILGESAGGHLALNWAYNSANTNYIKSIISCYAPTNMQQYGNYINSPNSFPCGTAYFLPTYSSNYFPWDIPIDLGNSDLIFNTTSPPNCNSTTTTPDIILANLRILDLYNIIQSSYSQIISTPSSNSTLLTYSPYVALNSSKIIPTFIMHGSADLLVPYPNATNGMDTKLDNTGGLIFNYPTSRPTDTVFTQYSSLTKKHGIKIYTGGNHGFGSGPFSTIRGDIIKWLKGHK